MTIEFDEKCQACKGTGIYRGMAERDGYAVVCRRCNGTGKFHFVHQFEAFDQREVCKGVHTVVEFNPGICLGGKAGAYNFGGISYTDWLEGKPFPQGAEMREYTCPYWWYQTANYNKRPRWKECNEGCRGAFSKCLYFSEKHTCWERFDAEQEGEE